MAKRWIYGTANPGGEYTMKDKILVTMVAFSTLGLLGAIGYMLIEVLK